jgi:hypothetical protein
MWGTPFETRYFDQLNNYILFQIELGKVYFIEL